MLFNSLFNILPYKKLVFVFTYLMFLILLFSLPAHSAAGDLDSSFGIDGVAISPGTNFFSATSIAVQPDGKIIAGGMYSPTNPPSFYAAQFALIRYLPNGLIDSSFGTNGQVTTSFSEYNSSGANLNDVVVLPNGKIVAVGSVRVPDTFTPFSRVSLFILRYNSDGSLDMTFNGNGKYIYSSGGFVTSAEAIAVQPDGKFLVTGYTGSVIKGYIPYKSLLFRFSGNGLDAAFGVGGIVVTQVSGETQGHSIALQPDGKIVVGGRTTSNFRFDLSLTRYNSDGSIDSNFGSSGRVIRVGENLSEAVDVLIQPDGRIVAIGSIFANSNSEGFALLRFNPDGSPDQSFGSSPSNGLVITQVTNLMDRATSTSLQTNGKIIVAGFSHDYSSSFGFDVALARYNPDGSLDRTFGIGGIVSKPSGFSLGGITLQTDGKILAVSTISSTGVTTGFRVIRYQANGTREFDFDGDSKTDVSIFRPNPAAEWYWLNSSNNQSSGLQFGTETDKPVPADYDGDGKTDVAVFRDGNWYRLNSSNKQFVAVPFGQAGDVPVPTDYDGDDKADLAVYRQGNWYILNSADNSLRAERFGISTDKPIIGDFDGDGKADLTVYRDGIWYGQRSRDGFFGVQFGINTDKPVAADYDGDGKSDLAVFRPSDGTWYLLRSHLKFTAIQFGIATDKLVTADYDGDGKADLGVYRDGDWYLLRSQQGFIGTQFGTANDKPVASSFVP